MSKVYVWGTGLILSRILEYRIGLEKITAFIDNDETKTNYMGKKVLRPDEIAVGYDAIIVASTHTIEIRKQCIELGLDMKKIIFLYNNISMQDLNENYCLVEEILGNEYADIIRNRYHLVRNISKDEIIKPFSDKITETPMYQEDYVRVKTLSLVADEIRENKVPGAVAELGVFKGEFARCINAEFPNRVLYLFDTFDGFEKQEAFIEKNNGSCNEVFIDAFKNVNVKKVMGKMLYPKNVIIRQGYFPKTAKEIEEKFAFVSLDVDFEESTLKGLEYFYPRLAHGGYIFIHDYNYGYFDCIKKAVKTFEEKYRTKLCKVPLCDAIGTLVITK